MAVETGSITDSNQEYPSDCYGYNTKGASSGVYRIQPRGGKSFQVFCDFTRDSGPWTVIQKRVDGSENFYRGIADYRAGFGSASKEFWVGLDHLHRLTRERSMRLRVDLCNPNGCGFGIYTNFRVGDAASDYTLTSATFNSGNIGDSLGYHVGRKFSAHDYKRDVWSSNCAVRFRGAWWYGACHNSNLNGFYGATGYADGKFSLTAF